MTTIITFVSFCHESDARSLYMKVKNCAAFETVRAARARNNNARQTGVLNSHF